MQNSDVPSKAQQLAAILSGNASTAYRTATVQRSHRFPIHEFMMIENLAKIADCSVAAMINQVIAVGIESLCEHLPEEMAKGLSHVTQEQVDKVNSNVSQKIGKYKANR